MTLYHLIEDSDDHYESGSGSGSGIDDEDDDDSGSGKKSLHFFIIFKLILMLNFRPWIIS